MVDQDDAKNDLQRVIADTAAVIRDLRDEGKTVFLHCVHAHTRTPVVAAAYGSLISGSPPSTALDRVLHALPGARPQTSVRQALQALDT